MKVSINLPLYMSSFAVPVKIADDFLPEATGIQLKYILWIFRNPYDINNTDKLCSELKIDRAEAENCAKFWINAGILTGEDIDTVEEPIPFIPSVKKEVTVESVKPSKPSSSEIAQRLDESPEIGHLFNEAQSKLGKTIGYDGQCTLLLLHDHYGLPTEVLFMLIDYCVSVGKTNYGYIETVGRSWGESEIDTLEKAASKIEALKSANSHWKSLASYAGLSNPRPAPKQSEYISRWVDEFKMSDEMICRAYDEMATHTGKLSFSYIDKILMNWFNSGYKTPSDVEAGEEKRAEQIKASGVQASASYDLDGFKEQSLHGTLKYERKKKQ